MSGKSIFERFLPQHARRVLDDMKPSGNMKSPIRNFSLLPQKSLEEAVEPLVSIIPNVKDMVAKAKEKCTDQKDHLTVDESAAIILYSLEWDPRENSFYIILNNTLRSEDEEKLKPWELYLKLFLNSLEKLPPIKKTIYRGVKLNLSAQYPTGHKFAWWSFSSCTMSVEVLQTEQFLGKTGSRTLFNIESNSGRSIKNHSLFPSEDEVLLMAARKFEVVSCLDSGNDLFIIQLKEIEEDKPLLGGSSSSFESIRSEIRDRTGRREEPATTTAATASSESSETASSASSETASSKGGKLPSFAGIRLPPKPPSFRP